MLGKIVPAAVKMKVLNLTVLAEKHRELNSRFKVGFQTLLDFPLVIRKPCLFWNVAQ
jgi:hypothetical protein